MSETPVPSPGRPRSEQARQAVLEAVDDLLVEVGYAAMTMKNIAERAGVGRPTVYRWWSSKAEILIEACAEDAATALATTASNPQPVDELASYLGLLGRFLTGTTEGLAYRALLGEAQHDPEVAGLVRAADILTPPTTAVLDRVRSQGRAARMPGPGLAVMQLAGPVLAQVLTTGSAPPEADLRLHAEALLAGWR